MNESNILILPEADEFLSLLPEILFKSDYYAWIESAECLVRDILEFIKTIPYIPHYALTEKAIRYFKRYGADYYVFFTRKSSPNTTWYIFFSKCDNRYLIRYITNNHVSGQYIL